MAQDEVDGERWDELTEAVQDFAVREIEVLITRLIADRAAQRLSAEQAHGADEKRALFHAVEVTSLKMKALKALLRKARE